jgi:hypothetical protein
MNPSSSAGCGADARHVRFIRHRQGWATLHRKEAIKMKSKKWLIAPITAAVLAVGALGSVSVYADTTPPAAPAAAEAADAAEPTTPEAAEPNEPALPGGGHADADGTNVDNQFDGVQ